MTLPDLTHRYRATEVARGPGRLTAPSPRTPTGARPSGFGRARQLWASLPRTLAAQFRPHADRMARDIVREIQLVVPEYAQPLEGQFGEIFSQGVQQAILHCIDNVGDPATPQQHWIAVFRQLGKIEFNAGRSLDCLQTAYRVGGRVAWRHVAEVAQSLNLDRAAFCIGAEAIFAYVDEISALSIEGYTAAQSRAAGAQARRRRTLMELVLATPPSSPQAVASLALSASWKLPERVTAVALEPRADQHELPTPAFDDDVLVDLEGAQPCLLFPGTVTDPEALTAALHGWRAAVGPEVTLTDAALSLQWARRAMGLVRRGTIADSPLTWCSEHLSTLWLLTDRFLIKELAEQSLAPLRDLTVKQRARLGETLLAWLQSSGSAPEIAERLKIHPQTVRYRLRQLEELFGDRLNNPDDRLDMEISLRAQGLTRPA